ncbi:MAG: DNA mismatch repair protein MutS [Clostridia bacterium]|nr:DNA mismatch repair protein MutS [Clostridia bacterium]MBR2634862.1 DNA mismatch repair protein MutS [Clostridia bacterium]
MMLQYLEIKKQYPDAFLFYRLGDFYEMFFDDAKAASKILELTLTGRDCGEAERAPMCGVPYHAADTYISRLVAKGHKVVICEQMEDPATAKGLVKRDIVRIVTPGTVTDNAMLDDKQYNYLCAICVRGNEAGIAFADASTGDINATLLKDGDIISKIITESEAYSPREALINVPLSEHKRLKEYFSERLRAVVNDGCEENFSYENAILTVKRQFGKNYSELGLENPVIVSCVGALISYIAATQKSDTSYIKNINVYTDGQFLEIDPNTRRNLELCETMRTKEKKGSLLWVLDRTRTSMGARLLRKWIELPLVNTHYIARRQDAVGELKDNYMLREELGETLRSVLDIERLMAKIVYGTANARDLRAIAETVSVVKPVIELMQDTVCEELVELKNALDPLDELINLLLSSIVEQPPLTVREGGMINKGINEELDRLHGLLDNSKGYLEALVEEERQITGISKLKYGYNRVFGYYLEVTNANKGEPLPDYYIRKQTLANAERYITPKLKELENAILGASEKICALEYDMFCVLRDKTASFTKQIQSNASLLALLDVYVSLSEVASRNNFVRPEISYDDRISIKDGRHPVVEQFVRDSYFVPNDTELDTSSNRLMLITGPNMAGKSTYMRQVAIITLMAQVGSFVPASDAHIGIVDKLFTRVGASDDLASGQSTFMLEMNEVAYILKNATKRSLIIYDEIGRGTSTFDGMSIAKAVAEYTAGKRLGAKTLFATHYHELTSLEGEIDGVINYNIAAKKKGDDIIFLRKIVRGSADESYGIEVAKLAGVPNEIIKRAKEVLGDIESGDVYRPERTAKKEESGFNLSFEDIQNAEIVEKLKSCDINTLTPIEALNFIFELKKLT